MKRALFLAPLVLGACSSGELAGGGGIETNNTLTLQASLPSGNSAAGALVRIRPIDWNEKDEGAAPGFLGMTDSNGQVRASLDEGDWIVEARTAGHGRMEHLQQSRSSKTALTLGLQELGALDGRIWNPGGIPVLIGLAGTPRSALTDSSGSFRFDSLSPGIAHLRLRDGTGRMDSLTIRPGKRDTLPWIGDPALRAKATRGAVVLDEFRSRQSTLAGAAPSVNWYLSDDRQDGGKSRVQRIDGSAASEWSDLLMPGDTGIGGGSVQLRFAVDTTAGGPTGRYAQIGMTFTSLGSCIDLSALDSVTFLARSTGPVRLEFRSAVHDSLNDFTSNPGFDLAPSASWQAVAIPVARLQPPSTATNPQVDWMRSRHCVLEMRFVSLHPATLGLGRLMMHGPGLAPFLHPARP
ncbi:MAG: hypothetical protein RL318_1679 [Fibrobacterota bacterium]|jgi:hypothetical protein